MRKLALVLGVLLVTGSFVAFLMARARRREFELRADSPEFGILVRRDAKLSVVATRFGFTEGPVWDSRGFLYVSGRNAE